MITDRFESERLEVQARLDALLKDGAECLVKDEATIVTSFYIDGFELLLPQGYFDRQTGALTSVTWWCWFREVHFEGGMERSHLIHVRVWGWLNERNLKLKTDDYELLIGSLDPAEVDPHGNAVWGEWQAFRRNNAWLEEVATEIRSEYLETARRAVG